jgi:hypothetical protein
MAAGPCWTTRTPSMDITLACGAPQRLTAGIWNANCAHAAAAASSIIKRAGLPSLLGTTCETSAWCENVIDDVKKQAERFPHARS